MAMLKSARAATLALWLVMTGDMIAVAAIRAHQPYEPDEPELMGVENLFLGAKVTASPHWSDRGPHFAVDGRHDNPGDHWAAENIPVQLTVHLPAPRDLNCIHLWTYWGDARYYQYFIEGSLDGENWAILADNRANAKPASAEGERFLFPTMRVQHVRITFTYNSVSNVAGGHIVEVEGYLLSEEAAQKLAAREQAWAQQPAGFHGAVGSTD
ncbi:MAG: discoidin domain-containing protein, partial [Armatimonadetes bacterium]|nr:discoidin domain-containing protein [Armatimonadota bacterium]